MNVPVSIFFDSLGKIFKKLVSETRSISKCLLTVVDDEWNIGNLGTLQLYVVDDKDLGHERPCKPLRDTKFIQSCHPGSSIHVAML